MYFSCQYKQASEGNRQQYVLDCISCVALTLIVFKNSNASI